jgi:hypothetical protein
MARSIALALVPLLLAAVLFAPGAALAEEKKAPVGPPVVSDDEAAEVLATFKENWRAKGLKGDDKLMQRDYALEELTKVQHPDVIEALGKVSRNPDSDLRTLAIMYLSVQKAYPHLAAKHVLKAMQKSKKDTVLLMTGLQTLGELKYLGARDVLADMLGHRDFIVRKCAINAVGSIGDLRMLDEVLKLLGMKPTKEAGSSSGGSGKAPAEGKGKGEGKGGDGDGGGGGEEKEDGYSWDGVEVTYDTGTAGDHDQQMAEAIGKEKLAANKAAAEAKAGKTSGGGGASTGGTGTGSAGGGGGNSGGAPGGGASSGGGSGRGAASRTTEELITHVLRTLKKLTGEEFRKPSHIRYWVKKNYDSVKERLEDLDAAEKAQKKVKK